MSTDTYIQGVKDLFSLLGISNAATEIPLAEVEQGTAAAYGGLCIHTGLSCIRACYTGAPCRVDLYDKYPPRGTVCRLPQGTTKTSKW